MSEYEKLDIERLYQITDQYEPDALRDQAGGWMNAHAMLKSLREALEGHYKAIEASWTSAASKPFLAEIQKTLHHIDENEKSARATADGLETIASYASKAKRDVKEAHDKWQEAKTQAQSEYETHQEAYEKSPAGYLLHHGPKPEEPDNDAIREQYSKIARGHMDTALAQHNTARPSIMRPVRPYKPVEIVPDDGRWLGGDDWGSDGASGSNATDSAGLAATSYGGNAVGASPALQSGGPAPVTPTPGAGGIPSGTPSPGMGGAPVGGVPVGGVPAAGRTPTPPVRPLSTGGNPTPRPSASAQRTPGLPTNRANATGSRPGSIPGSRPNTTGRPGTVPGNGRGAAGGRGAPGVNGRPGAGRGLQKSQYAPQDRTGRVRASGEVMGRRTSTAKQEAEKSRGQKSPRTRRIQPSVIKGAKTSGTKTAPTTRRGPADRTGQGYTRQVIGGRQRTEFSRTPLVGRRLDPTAGQNILGQQTPQTEEDKAQRLMDERRARRRAMQQSDEAGLSRPVIDNGITHAAQLDEAKPTGNEAVKAEDSFWQLDDQQVTRGVIGQPRPMPEADHDPGPGVITSRGSDVPQEESAHYDPGPTAFGRQRPDTTNWP